MNGKSYAVDLNLNVVASAIKEHVPSADVKFNMVPKVHAMSDIYCQLVPNDDDNNPFYEVVPRIGSFEVSCNGVVSTIRLIYRYISYSFQKCSQDAGQITMLLVENVRKLQPH